MVLVMCLIGCGKETTDYQEITITETEVMSDQEDDDKSEQEILAKDIIYRFHKMIWNKLRGKQRKCLIT